MGLQCNRARHDDSETGRWLNLEPIGYEAGENLYRCVGNAPCNDADPSGLEYNRARHFDPTPGVFLNEDAE